MDPKQVIEVNWMENEIHKQALTSTQNILENI